MRSQIVPARTFETSGPALAFDVMLLAPNYHVWCMTRPAEPDFVDRLAGFLFAAANDFHPEQSLATFSDTTMGLTIAVVSSTDDRVELEATVLADPDLAIGDELDEEVAIGHLISFPDNQDAGLESDFLSSQMPFNVGGFSGLYPDGSPWMFIG